jgi:uncharacterized protein (TIGR02266 family)
MYASRREHVRIPAKVEVTLSSEHNFFVGWSENISEGGLFIATHQLHPLGTRFDITLSVPPHLEEVTITCEVRWLRQTDELTSDCGPGMGLAFCDLATPTADAIQRFLAEQRDALFVDI